MIESMKLVLLFEDLANEDFFNKQAKYLGIYRTCVITTLKCRE